MTTERKWANFWTSTTGKEILRQEREKTFAGEKRTITEELIDDIHRKYLEIMRSTPFRGDSDE